MEEEFALFNAWVDRRLGIPLAAYKENQMQRRILTIMENSGAKTLREYQQLIEGDEGVRAAFLAHITINVTEFYRNKELFDAFERILKTIVLPKTTLPKIWSAACSIGAEPYTIAMLLEKTKLLQPMSWPPISICKFWQKPSKDSIESTNCGMSQRQNVPVFLMQ
ncbi:hypothetical protein OM428_04560 [Enterococcus gallinarum]|nr:Chemotaxis protein methyltransferase CheR [Enterococcus sp. HSIEG1]MCW3744403.1 hypothetical protein [Enterococcus gallinarum]